MAKRKTKLKLVQDTYTKTYQFRIKDSSHKNELKRLASKVNYVWNYANATSSFAWKRDRKWLSEFDIGYLTTGASRLLGLHSDTINSINAEFTARRNKAKRARLRWRSYKKNLGWIPLKGRAVKLSDGAFVFQGRKYKFWQSREIEGKFASGSITQDSKGNWFVNMACKGIPVTHTKSKKEVGIDLGLKDLATRSDGVVIRNPKTLAVWAEKLAKAQRANKKRRVTAIHMKIKNIRKDFLHKESTKLVKEFKKIFVGNVSSSKLAKTKMAKSVLDAGWGVFKTMLGYKAITLGVELKVIDEKYSTVTCSDCLERSGPSGLSALGVRSWECSCGAMHDRDVNAAKNILRFADERVSLQRNPRPLGRGGR